MVDYQNAFYEFIQVLRKYMKPNTRTDWIKIDEYIDADTDEDKLYKLIQDLFMNDYFDNQSINNILSEATNHKTINTNELQDLIRFIKTEIDIRKGLLRS